MVRGGFSIIFKHIILETYKLNYHLITSISD